MKEGQSITSHSTYLLLQKTRKNTTYYYIPTYHYIYVLSPPTDGYKYVLASTEAELISAHLVGTYVLPHIEKKKNTKKRISIR